MRYLLIPLLLAGCETMTPSGQPFAPVQVDTPTAPSAPVAVDPAFDFPEFQMSSEELHAGGQAEVVAPPEPEAPAPEVQPVVQQEPSPPLVVAPVTAPVATAPPVTGWPVRLVRTLPETQPPRAILGMPDGQEIVVTPGAMVPDQGLVVIAIGHEHVELAKITAVGDHATVASQTITSQY